MWKKTALICGVILLIGAGLITWIFSTEPKASRSGATRETAMLVDVTGVTAGTFRPTIVATGTVKPAADILLKPRVGGEIVERAEAFTPGGFVEKGDLLLRIDPADYENQLRQRKSELQQAIADLKLEQGRQDVARKEFEILNDTVAPENRSLVLRRPQLNVARARVASARAAVEQARLALGRTEIRAPFDAHVLSRDVNLGSQVDAGDTLGRLVGLDTYWIETTVPLSKLRWLSFPGADGPGGSEVRVRNSSAWPEGLFREGRLYRLIGSLEDQTRMARVLVSVDDPLLYRAEKSDMPPLMIGAFVETHIEAREIDGVVRLERDYVRKNDTVWVMRSGELDIRDVEVVFRDDRYAYIGSGLEAGDRVVTTNLSTVVDGARLRVEEEGREQETPDQVRSSGGTA